MAICVTNILYDGATTGLIGQTASTAHLAIGGPYYTAGFNIRGAQRIGLAILCAPQASGTLVVTAGIGEIAAVASASTAGTNYNTTLTAITTTNPFASATVPATSLWQYVHFYAANSSGYGYMPQKFIQFGLTVATGALNNFALKVCVFYESGVNERIIDVNGTYLQ